MANSSLSLLTRKWIPKGKRASELSWLLRASGESAGKQPVSLWTLSERTHYGVIGEEPEKLLQIKGIGKKTLASIIESYNENREFAKVYKELSDLDIDLPSAVKIYKLYGPDAINIIKGNPYQLADDIYGITFARADRIGVRLGIQPDSPFRIRSGIKYQLGKWAGSGSTFVPKEDLKLATMDLLEVTGDQIGRMPDSHGIRRNSPDRSHRRSSCGLSV